jgi:methionine-rich copper-binding protein CopC
VTRGRRRGLAGVLALAALLIVPVGAGRARAHGLLERAEPRPGATVRAAPAAVRVWFSERVEIAYSRVRVFDPAGRQVDGGAAAVDAAGPRVLRVALPPLAPGRYVVRWRVLSVDSHVTEGEFSFRIVP